MNFADEFWAKSVKRDNRREDISEFEHKLELNTRLLSTISEIMKDPGENYNDALRAG